MTVPDTSTARQRCVGAVVHDDRQRLLLVRRGRDPGRGRWSVPGGRVEPGETDGQALRREVGEETGLRVHVGERVGSVTLPAPGGGAFEVHDYRCRPVGTALRAGDDADDARWCDAADLAALPVVAGLVDALGGWGCLPR